MNMMEYEQMVNTVILRWKIGLMSEQERDNAIEQIVDDILKTAP